MKVTELKANPLYHSHKTVDSKPARHTIESVEVRQLNETDRVVITLKDDTRDLRLTARQVAVLARFWGDESDDWKGKQIDVSKDGEQGIAVIPVADEKGK